MRVAYSCFSVLPSPASQFAGYVFLSSLMSVFDRLFQFFFFWCDFSFQTICWRGLESTQWLQEETRSPPLKTLQEVKQRSPTVSSVLSFLWWDFCHFYWLDLTVHTAKILFFLTCWYSVKAYWMESEGLYSFRLPTQLFSSLLSPSNSTT